MNLIKGFFRTLFNLGLPKGAKECCILCKQPKSFSDRWFNFMFCHKCRFRYATGTPVKDLLLQ
jgi:hypothetical protein